MRTRRSLRARITLACTAVITVTVCALAAVAYGVVRHELNRSADLELSRQATLAARLRPGTQEFTGPCEFLAAPACVQTVTSAGMAATGDTVLPVTAAVRAVAGGRQPAYYTDITIDGHAARMYVAPLRPGTAVQVALRTDVIDQDLDRIGIALGVVAAAGIALAVLAGAIAARGGLRPLTALTTTAEQVAVTADPGQSIEIGGHDEIARLGRAFNSMLQALRTALASLKDSVAAQRRLVADASHELRTPLTSLRTYTDLLAREDRLAPADRRRIIAAVNSQARELTEMVADLIELARGDDPEAPDEEFEDIALDQLVRRCVQAAQRDWPGAVFTADVEPTWITGQTRPLARAVGNLLNNAAKFSGETPAIGVRLHQRELVVRDNGPGVSDEALPHVFDRFYRAPQARRNPGSGLGLAIVKQVADRHQAIVRAESPPGGGCVIRIRFPSSTDEPRGAA